MLKKSWILQILAVILTVTAVHFPGLAQRSCDLVHSSAQPFSLQWRVESKDKELLLDEKGNIRIDSPAGALFLSEQPLAPKSRMAVMELVRMINHTRAVKFSFKDFEGKALGSLVLGLPLEKGWSVEITYKSDFRTHARYIPKNLVLIDPSGNSHQVRNTLLNMDGTLDTSINFDLNDFTGINFKDFKLHIPSEISGEVLTEFGKIAPRLELLTKDELRDLANSKNYFRMKTLMHYRAFKTKMGQFMNKEYFKTFLKMTMRPMIIFSVFVGAVTFFPNQVLVGKNFVQSVLSGDQKAWLNSALDKAVDSPTLPETVKNQMRDLKSDFDKTLREQSPLYPKTNEYPANLNAEKFQVSKDQFMWIVKHFDKDQNREVTLFFITQDNKFGNIDYAVTEIDSKKYSALINYLQNKGQFLPIQMEGIAQ
ncbi:MAG: hypothetical protein ACAH59_11115 [Pseudobdellovibrionaceae bacterium]